MILAALSLLSMSLNAQLLPDKHKGGFRSATPAGMAYLYTPNGQFRMPSLGSNEYLFGPYITDDFDATGASLYDFYTRAQDVTIVVDMLRSEFEEHLGDQIIGFRFALAGSNPVQVKDFGLYPANDEQYADESTVWNLAALMSGNTGTGESTTTTTTTDVTFTAGTDNVNSNTITKNNVTITNIRSTTSNNSFSYNPYRIYTGSLTFTVPEGSSITKIVFSNITQGNTSSFSLPTNGSGTYSDGTWTGDSRTVTLNVSSQVRLSNIAVTYTGTTTTYTHTVEIGRGSTKYEYLPVSGYNMDYGFQNQMIYRAGQLAMANGAQITGITFYPEEGQGIPFSGSTVTVSLANISNDNFGNGTTGNKITSGLQTVATITPVADHDATVWKIDFDTPFNYEGGNLLVQMQCPGNGNYAHAYFMGDNQSSNVSLVSTGIDASLQTSGNTSTFLPKATFR